MFLAPSVLAENLKSAKSIPLVSSESPPGPKLDFTRCELQITKSNVVLLSKKWFPWKL